MQTFVTYMSHVKTMRDLDNARLGKQRLETFQILRLLRGETSSSWSNHPAVQMWAGYEPALTMYGLFVCHEWRIVREFNDKLWGDFGQYAKEYGMLEVEEEVARGACTSPVENPPWLSDKWVLRSHRSNLMRKAPHIYTPKYEGTPENMPYLWPREAFGTYSLTISKPDMARLETGERVLPEGLRLWNNIVKEDS